MESQTVKPGLQDVVACESSICYIDGQKGRLTYRGYDIEDVASNLGFEDTAYLLWHGSPPSPEQSSELDSRLRELRELPDHIVDVLRQAAPGSDPVGVLRAGMALWAAEHQVKDPRGFDDPTTAAENLTAKMATMLAAIHRIRQGSDPVPPNNQLRHAANILYMLHGSEPTDTEAQTLETVLVLYAEHELNASTFTARVTAGTQADTYSTVLAAICALKGPLHGGAVNDVMDMLTEVSRPDNASEWVTAALSEKRKIPGFGHRVYRVQDPRATHLREIALQLADQSQDRRWIDVALAIQEAVQETKPLNVNVDYFAAPVLSSLGFPPELFTSLVACTRVTGWTAHVMEQYADNRLIRPRAAYRGETDLTLCQRA